MNILKNRKAPKATLLKMWAEGRRFLDEKNVELYYILRGLLR